MTTTFADFADLTAWIRLRWPGTRLWAETLNPDLHPDFAHLPLTALRQAIEAWYDQGHPTPPKPAVLRAAATKHAATTAPSGPCPHRVYSIGPDEDGYRHARCVACGHEWQAVAEQLLTPGEKADLPVADVETW